jgi:hypothetical protein
MTRRGTDFVLCVQNRGAEDLELRKVYRVVPDAEAAAAGHLRIVDESGEDYLYPAAYFVAVALTPEAERAWTAARGPGGRRGPARPARAPGRRPGRLARSAG